jgi:hypothetical protein
LGHQPLLAVSSCLLIVFASTFHTWRQCSADATYRETVSYWH